MATKQKANRIHTPQGVASFVNVFIPRQRTDPKGNPQGGPKYSLALFFDKDADLTEMKAAAKAKLIEAFGANAPALVKKGKINWPFADTADMDDPGPPFDQPGTVVNFKSADKPGVVDEDAEPIMDKSDVYSGMLARVSCRCFSYDNASKGVAFALINVQKLGDGDRLSGNPSAEDDFADTGKKPAGKRRAAENDVDDLL